MLKEQFQESDQYEYCVYKIKTRTPCIETKACVNFHVLILAYNYNI